MKNEVIIHSFGAGIMLGLSGENGWIKEEQMILYNWGCINSELNWWTDNFAYTSTTEEKYKKFLYDREENKYWINHNGLPGGKKIRNKLKINFKQYVKKIFDETIKENFLTRVKFLKVAETPYTTEFNIFNNENNEVKDKANNILPLYQTKFITNIMIG